MRNLTVRALTWLHGRRGRPHDDRGLETAEVLAWMAVGAFAIVTLAGRLDDILNRVVDTIDSALPG